MLTLVRHAMPTVDPATPAHTWGLSDEGRIAATALKLPPGYHVASAEPKAAQTLQAARPEATVHIDPGFGEILRPHDPTLTGEGHRALAEAYLRGADHAGWETRERAFARFDGAIARNGVPGRGLVVATHGMVMTVWLSEILGLSDPVVFWRGLNFPDVVSLETPRRRPAAS